MTKHRFHIVFDKIYDFNQELAVYDIKYADGNYSRIIRSSIGMGFYVTNLPEDIVIMLKLKYA